MADTAVPEGYMKNAQGHFVPAHQVREHDKLRDQVARDLVSEALELNSRLKAFKGKALHDIADLVKLAGERFEVTLGGKKGNVTIATYDGEFKVLRSVAERIRFTEEIEAAKALINNCIMRWSQGANPHIQALVDRAFRTDAQGQIKTTAVLELLRTEIDDEEWKRAMNAIREAIQGDGTSTYVRLYRRTGPADNWEAIPLDLAAV